MQSCERHPVVVLLLPGDLDCVMVPVAPESVQLCCSSMAEHRARTDIEQRRLQLRLPRPRDGPCSRKMSILSRLIRPVCAR